MIVVSGLGFAFEPEDALSPAERERLVSLESPWPTGEAAPPHLTVQLERQDEPSASPSGAAPVAAPARVAWEAGRLVVTHAAFTAEVDAPARQVRLRRDPRTALGLVTVLRTAVSARLPLEGGLVLHAAGLERCGDAYVFFGPSGIGKSTLAARSPWPVLSDELVAVRPGPGANAYRAAGTAFRRPEPGSPAPTTPEPRLVALVELAQGPKFFLERLEPQLALRRLLGSITVPPGPPLWTAALGVAATLAQATPCYRMAWSLDESPFELLALALGAE